MGLNIQITEAQRARHIELDLFTYNAIFPIAAFVGAATITIQIPITSDSDFVLDCLNLVSYTAVGVLNPNPDYQIFLVDSGSGRNLMDVPVHVNNYSGTGQLPFYLPEPKLFKGAATIGVTLVNNTAVAAKVDVSFIGRKIFYIGQFNRDMLMSGVL